MCGRFSQSERVDHLAAIFGAEPDDDLPEPSWNVAPTDRIAIVVDRPEGRRLTSAGWGFHPFWHDRPGAGWINARSETALESPAFGPALRGGQRCLIPVDAFYEWDRSHRPPQPYAIGAAHGGPLALAGIWTAVDGGTTVSAAILTTGPNRTMRPIHHRMPVILRSDAVDAWLATDADLDAVLALLVPAPDDALRVWPVSTAVNSVRHDGPDLLRPLEGLPATLGL